MVLDDLDRTLLRLLQEDARRSFRTLASMAETTVPTAASRIRRMEEIGIIKGYSVVLDDSRFHGPDLSSAVAVACHTCSKETSEPLWSNVDGRRHPFCCPHCKADFERRFERMTKP